jgi:hypothetical protein
MARDYPAVVDTRRQRKWIDMGADKGPKCCVCGAKATHHPFVEVNLFRGDDMGPYKACELHATDPQALLNSTSRA